MLRKSNEKKRRICRWTAQALLACMVALQPLTAWAEPSSGTQTSGNVTVGTLSGMQVTADGTGVQAGTADAVKLMEREGTVELQSAGGRQLTVLDGMRLYDGYQLKTLEKSYAYLALDDSKLATLDALSELQLEKKGSHLSLFLSAGSLFFDVSKKLGEQETMNIQTANVSLGVRGTSGLVQVLRSGHTRVYLFDGELDVSVSNQFTGEKKTTHMTAGKVADFVVYRSGYTGENSGAGGSGGVRGGSGAGGNTGAGAYVTGGNGCEIYLRGYVPPEVPGFVLCHMREDAGLVERILTGGGGDFRPYLEDAQTRRAADEAQTQARLDAIAEVYAKQPHSGQTVPLFGDDDTSDDAPAGGSSGTGGGTAGEETETPTAATLLSGSQINQKIQELLNHADTQASGDLFGLRAWAGAADLTALRWSQTAAAKGTYTVNLAASGSAVDAWCAGGVVWLYSDAPSVSLPSDCSGLLQGFYNLTDLSALAEFETGGVTNLSNAFASLRALTDLSPISGWDVSGVTDLSYAFSGCTSLTELSALSGWDVGAVTDFGHVFAYDSALASVEGIRDWNTTSATSITNIFSGCGALTDAGCLSSHSVGGYMAWDVKPLYEGAAQAEEFADTGVAQQTDYSGYPDWFMKTYSFIGEDGTTVCYEVSVPMDTMDLGAAVERELEANAPEYLKGWNTSLDGSGEAFAGSGNSALVTEDIKFYYQPLTATLLPGREVKEKFKDVRYDDDYITSVTWDENGPAGTSQTYVISTPDSDREVVAWTNYDGTVKMYGDVKTVYLNPDCSKMFEGMDNLEDISGLARLDCSKVTDMSYMFYHCFHLTDLSPLKDWDTSNVTSLESTFSYVDRVKDFSALAGWDTSNVTTMKFTFSDHQCPDFSGLAGWDTSKVESFQATFSSGTQRDTFTDLSAFAGWDTSSATTMRNMFAGCSKFTNVDELAGWDVSRVTDLSAMFGACEMLMDLDGLAEWDVSNVTDMSMVFSLCKRLEDVTGLSDWDVSAATTMFQMFYGNEKLSNLEPLADWDPASCMNFGEMFDCCGQNLDGTVLSGWRPQEGAEVRYMFENQAQHPWWYQDGKLVLPEKPAALTLAVDEEIVDEDAAGVQKATPSDAEPSDELPAEGVPGDGILAEELPAAATPSDAEPVDRPPADGEAAAVDPEPVPADGEAGGRPDEPPAATADKAALVPENGRRKEQDDEE